MSVDIASIVSTARTTKSLINLARAMPRDPIAAMTAALAAAGQSALASALRGGRIDRFRSAFGPLPVTPAPDSGRLDLSLSDFGPPAAAGATASGDPPPQGAVLLSLGVVQFLTSTLAHQSIARSVDYRWAAQERLGRAPAQQFVGRGAETIELSGYTLTHYTGGGETIARLRAMADQGEPQSLIDSTGTVLGQYVLTRVETTGTELDASGRPLMLDFRLALTAYGEDA